MPSEIPADVGTDDNNPDEVVCRCPGMVRTAAWTWILFAGAMLLLCWVWALPHNLRMNATAQFIMSGRIYPINNWVGAGIYTAFQGAMVALGVLTLKGRAWAYYVLVLLIISGLATEAYERIQLISGPNGFGIRLDNLLETVILVMFGIGFKEYREFCRSRRVTSQSAV